MVEIMKTVKEICKITGVSARTLHHYDAIGLLKPTKVTEAGYRTYDDAALRRLQNILLFRELQFPLKEIKEILDSPDFDPSEALDRQIKLLELQYKRIGELIVFAREIQTKGATPMNFDVFDASEIERHKAEVIAKWGATKAYQEYEKKDSSRNQGGYGKTANELMTIFSELGGLKHLNPDSDEALMKISELQNFITENYYECANEILGGLGKMYVCDERFKKNIDKAGGDGTAEFIGRAIAAYCSRSD